METMHERKTKVVEEVLKRLRAQPVKNRIYRIGENHFRYYHIFDRKDKTDQYAFSFYYGIGQKILEGMQRYKSPHILIMCDHKNTDLIGEDAVDLLFIPAGFFLGSLRDVSFKPSSVEKGDPSWNMNIRVTKDKRYLLDLPGKENIPLEKFLNRFNDIGIEHEINLRNLAGASGLEHTFKTDILPTKADCEMALKAFEKAGKGSSITKEQVFEWLEQHFRDKEIVLKRNWRIITERNLEIWFS